MRSGASRQAGDNSIKSGAQDTSGYHMLERRGRCLDIVYATV
jgi:hypothetical protein